MAKKGISGYEEHNLDRPKRGSSKPSGIAGYSERNLEPMSKPPKVGKAKKEGYRG